MLLPVVAASFATGVAIAELVPALESRANSCSGLIEAVEFLGNDVTRESTLQQFVSIKAGSFCTAQALLDSRQAIMNSGLFKAVDVTFDAAAKTVRFSVVERHYTLPIPRFDRTSDGELRIGGQLRMDNVLGLNHRFRITARHEAADNGRGNAGNRLTTSYQIPRLLNSDFGFKVALSALDKAESLVADGVETGLVQKRQGFVGVEVTRFFQRSTSLAGWQTRMGAGLLARDYQLTSGDQGNLVSGGIVQLRLAARYSDVQEGKYRRVGHQYGIALSGSSSQLLSDFSFIRLDAYYQTFIPLTAGRVENVNLRVKAGIADRGPFGENTYSIGGSGSTRGFASGTQVGQRQLLLNAEYLRAFASRPTLRWIAFLDMGVVKGERSFRLADLRTGLGTGIRWKIRSFVNTDLRLDVAWGIGDRDGGGARFYFGTNVVF